MRMALERELMYAAEYPFVDYGVDLKEMAQQEKGLRVARLTVKPVDTRQGEEHVEDRAVVDHLSK